MTRHFTVSFTSRPWPLGFAVAEGKWTEMWTRRVERHKFPVRRGIPQPGRPLFSLYSLYVRDRGDISTNFFQLSFRLLPEPKCSRAF